MRKKPRQGACVFVPHGQPPLGAENQRPELWNLYNARKTKGESIRVFPMSNWMELDIWQYIHLENIEIVPLYFAAPRPTVERDGLLLWWMMNAFALPRAKSPKCVPFVFARWAATLTGAVESNATTLPEVIQEMLLTTTSERQGRAIDHDAAASMEKKNRRLFLMAGAETVYETDADRRDIDAYLEQHRHKTMLRFITCGSVDDGKSTLIGRLLYDSKMIFEDQLASLEADSRKMGTQGENIDFALLVDGLAAEREQGITIDVAYRFFATEKRKFIVADTPGHEQYTRNMVTGASTADLAVILVDARQGVLTQTRRHSYLVHLLGIRHIVLAVTKWIWSITTKPCSTKSSPITEHLPPKSALKISRQFPFQGWPATILPENPMRPIGIAGQHSFNIWKRSRSTQMRQPKSRFVCLCNGSTDPIWIFAALAA